MGHMLDPIPHGDLSFAHNGEVKTCALALKKTFRHVCTAETDAELEARHARLSHHKFGRTELEAVTDIDLILDQALRREVLAEDAPPQFHVGNFRAPVGVVLRWIDIDRLVSPTM